jgi:anion-transporting  ArsA/GET3 family ATPase
MITEKYAEMGHTPPSLESKEDIISAQAILKSLQENQKQINRLQDQIPTPSGSAPLNNQQVYGKIPEQSFENTKDMIDYLRKNKTPENEAILRKLFEKMVQGIVEKRSWELPFENANPKSKSESDSNVKAVEVNIHSIKEGESEIEKWTKKKRRIE